jgi:hypothetical protein
MAEVDLAARKALFQKSKEQSSNENNVDEPDDSENSPLSRENMFFFSDLVDWI